MERSRQALGKLLHKRAVGKYRAKKVVTYPDSVCQRSNCC